jgi:large subunit ribosomal protein L15
MQLHELTTPRKNPKGRVGRGIAAGQGKTAGRGTKGQKSRTGYKAPKRLPGMMSASDYRLPKVKGFNSHRPELVTVTLRQLDHAFAQGETVSPDSLVAKKLISHYTVAGVKVLATGTLTKKLKFEAIRMTEAAARAIEKLGTSAKTAQAKTEDIPTEA